MLNAQQKEKLIAEISFTATRSSGPGGQHVNKVNTKVVLRFNLEKSRVLCDYQKMRIQNKLSNIINVENEIIITDQSSRSQLKNKLSATQKFFMLINKALTIKKKRIASSPTRASKRRRIENKKKLSEKKFLRRRVS